ncbi:hypothetical protein ACODT3_43270, partial [Streptomyces sp. 4.24]|uniref:hypothetical protein n=1 Tax=Streptomyces tritrimontium TaxID=3406573 RepID=UPI003BB76B17
MGREAAAPERSEGVQSEARSASDSLARKAGLLRSEAEEDLPKGETLGREAAAPERSEGVQSEARSASGF